MDPNAGTPLEADRVTEWVRDEERRIRKAVRGLLPTAAEHEAVSARHRRTVIVCHVNGILTRPADEDAWTDRAVRWWGNRHWVAPVAYEYFAGPIFRRLWQQGHAQGIVDVCAARGDFYRKVEHELHPVPVILVGHSNGADLVDRALALPWPAHVRPAAAVLVAGASEASFARTAWGDWFRKDPRFRVRIYCSPVDRALQLGALTRVLKPFGLGYGKLGLVGPRDLPSNMVVDEKLWRRLSVVRQPTDHVHWIRAGRGLEHLLHDVQSIAQMAIAPPWHPHLS